MTPTIVSKDRWTTERLALLAHEKELTKLQDRIARERQALPWVRVDKPYVFDTPNGARTLAELFGSRRTLLVQHFMLGPGWEEGCASCSFMADHTDGMTPHLAQQGVAFVAVSRAPLAEIERFRQRMGWRFDWVSSAANDFNWDYAVSFRDDDLARGGVDYNYVKQPFPHNEAPGVSVFVKDEAGAVFHTYSTYGRGVEVMMGTYRLIDLLPQGRVEGSPMDWVRHHDRYDSAPAGGCCASHS